MDQLYSTELKQYSGELSPALLEAVQQIKNYYSIQEIKVLEFNSFYVAVPINIPVSIPTRGTVNNIDIRKVEPMLLKVSLVSYPYEMPSLLSDRKDFPRNQLPHLYATPKDKPAALCLVRNSRNEWFANKMILDLIALGEEWLYKAATNQLLEDGNEFDPLRLENYYGYHIYKYSIMKEIVDQKIKFLPVAPFSVVLSYGYKKEYQNLNGLTYRSLSVIPYINKDEILKAISTDSDDSAPLLSIVLWHDGDEVENTYCTDFPTKYGELRAFFLQRGIELEKVLFAYKKAGCHLRNGIPIIFAIKRPRKLVGYDGNYEFLNFLIMAKSTALEKIPDEIDVKIQSHIEPFSQEVARKVSGQIRNTKTLFLGAGSLGSKMIIHEARSGNLNVGVVDGDDLLQHNLVRHSLFSNRVGLNKAMAVINEIESMFESDDRKGLAKFDFPVNLVASNKLTDYKVIIDTTASIDTLNWLVNEKLSKVTIVRGEIADEGKLGLLYIEGSERNPRIDDLVNFTYYQALRDKEIRSWRINDSKREIFNLSVGLGCSSTTTILGDDTISLHASLFSKVVYQYGVNSQKKEGLIYLNKIADGPVPTAKTEFKLVKPFDSYKCLCNSGWEIRLCAGLADKMISLCNAKKNKETGGVLVGMCNYKTKVIHIFDIIVEPRGSSGTYCGFIRGSIGLPAEINSIKEATGNVIGYIGEWHTHPMNLENLSDRDLATVKELISINRKVPIPTCTIIATRSKMLPFIFE